MAYHFMFACVIAGMMTLGVGQMVDRYRIEGVLGEGGMATVYAAVHTFTHELVAMKVLLPALSKRADLVEKFLSEAKVQSKIGKSPFLVPILDAKVDNGLAFLVMPRLEGETLEQRLTKGALPREQVAWYLRQLGMVMDQAHQRGVIHRDLKPANLFLTHDENEIPVVKVMDFGIAKVLENEQHTATSAGTPLYAAPEQQVALRMIAEARGKVVSKVVGPATDVWALGLLAYDMLTGHEPGQLWAAENQESLYEQILQESVYASLRAGVAASVLPAGFDEWVRGCLRLDMQQRHAEFGKAVEALIGLLAIPEEQLPPLSRASVSSRSSFNIERSSKPDSLVIRVADANPVDTTVKAKALPETQFDLGQTLAPQKTQQGAQVDQQHIKSNNAKWALLVGVVGVLVVGSGVVKYQSVNGNNNIALTSITGSSRADSSTVESAVSSGRIERNSVATVTGSASAAATGGTAGSANVQPVTGADSLGGSAMIRITGGTFKMGDMKTATVRDFEIDQTEVTVRQYRQCVESGKCTAPDAASVCNWDKPDRLNHPVNCVDWHQATSYCQAVQKRLPTEEEWEFAARGSDGRTYPWGRSAPGNQLCWDGEGSDVGRGKRRSTCEVGKYPTGASPFGVLDMAGNVWEWTSSPQNPNNNDSNAAKILRGGSWDSVAAAMIKSSNRQGREPSNRMFFLGFRCAR